MGARPPRYHEEKMIFVLDKANDLYVSNEAELQGAFEGIDVEDGEYLFFDESGKSLIQDFVEPNRRGTVLVQSGKYRLIGNPDKSACGLAELLRLKPVVQPNPYFADLDAVRRFLDR
jgi:hypothetical protein